MLSSCRVNVRIGYGNILPRAKKRQKLHHVCTCFFDRIEAPGRISTNNSKEFSTSCQGGQRTPETNTRHRSETNGIEDRAVRQVEEGTAEAMIVHSRKGLQCLSRRIETHSRDRGTCLVLSVFAWSQVVLTQSLCAGMPCSAHGTAEVGASSGIGVAMPA